MAFVAFSHVVAAALLAVPQTRFVGGLLELPMSIGIVCFHIAMEPQGIAVGLIVLLLNVGTIYCSGKCV